MVYSVVVIVVLFYYLRMSRRTIVFFDFDGTITDNDTFISFGRYVCGNVRFFAGLVAALPWIVMWKCGLISNSEAKQRLFGQLYRGMKYERFRSYGEAFAAQIDKLTRRSTISLIYKHIQRGHTVVIVTASVADWVRPWALSHGITDVIATEAAVDGDGKLTGKFSTPNCYGSEKVRRIKERFPEITECETYAYGDSSGDDEMLRFVHHGRRL